MIGGEEHDSPVYLIAAEASTEPPIVIGGEAVALGDGTAVAVTSTEPPIVIGGEIAPTTRQRARVPLQRSRRS